MNKEEVKSEQVLENTLESKSLLDTIIQEGRMAKEDQQIEHAKDLLAEFVNQILEEGMTVSGDVIKMINARIAQIDNLLTAQVNEILHNENFKKLESSWRGLHYFISNTETSESQKIKVLNVTKNELLKDLEKASDFDQSALFKLVYENEYGTFGGTPFGALIGDYEFGRNPQDVTLLSLISNVAAAAHAPFLSAASPLLFDMDSFTDIGTPKDMHKIFETADMAKWRSFRESDDAKYVALALPHILMRLPYGPDTVPVEGFNFVENVDGKTHDKYLWGNAAYALGSRITDSFAKYKWTSSIRGVEGGGIVQGLPTHSFKTDDGDVDIKCPTEVAITDRREKELNDLGFISLCHAKGTDYAVFFGGQTVQKPKTYNTDEANANAQISARLPYVMAASRFAHYLKSITRDKIGSFETAETISNYLNIWIKQYVLAKDDASNEQKAKHPLREARVEVSEIKGRPGSYNSVIFLKPHFQMEELTASLRLVAELPSSKG